MIPGSGAKRTIMSRERRLNVGSKTTKQVMPIQRPAALASLKVAVDRRAEEGQHRPTSASPSPSTKSSLLRAQWARKQQWPDREHNFAPSWEFDEVCKSPQRAASAQRYGEEDWKRLASPRAGYARDDLTGPSKKASAAVYERNQFLHKHGYVNNPRELLRRRFHGTSAEQTRSQNSARAAAQSAAAEHLSKEQQRLMLLNCWRTGKSVPEYLLRRQQSTKAP